MNTPEYKLNQLESQILFEKGPISISPETLLDLIREIKELREKVSILEDAIYELKWNHE